jgi:hypothetical protein
LNADSEFLVHFYVGPQFKGLAHWDRVIYYEIINKYLKVTAAVIPEKTI